MAITFEQKSNFGKNMLILAVLVLALAGGVFYIWKTLQQGGERDASATPSPRSSGIDTGIFQDPFLAELEIFPEIPFAEPEPPRQNPFAKQSGIVGAGPRNNGGAVGD